MAETPVRDEMGYEAMAQNALRGVVRAALERAAMPEGLPGDHHFYITFKTRAKGVSVPPDVSEKYPDEITVVMQHQYWDLTIDDDGFSVLLKFGGQPKKLSTPWTAVVRFYDPSVQFLLQFEAPELPTEPEPEDERETPPPPLDDGPKVVSLDQFRKK